jgi:hypothetical protein
MGIVKRVAISVAVGAIALALSFALVFGGGLAWEVSRYPHDGQAGMGSFFLAVVLAPVVGLLAFVCTFERLRR